MHSCQHDPLSTGMVIGQLMCHNDVHATDMWCKWEHVMEYGEESLGRRAFGFWGVSCCVVKGMHARAFAWSVGMLTHIHGSCKGINNQRDNPLQKQLQTLIPGCCFQYHS